MFETLCKKCGRQIIILQSADPKNPIIVDGDRSDQNKEELHLYRHLCEKTVKGKSYDSSCD
jgi:hypothetical protein